MQADWQRLIEHTVQDNTLRRAYNWEPYGKGSSNSIFLGCANKTFQAPLPDTVVLRINAPPKDTPGVIRQREAEIINLIISHHWAPQVIRNEPNQGWCLMHHYDPLPLSKGSLERLPALYEKQLFQSLNELQAIAVQSQTLNYDYAALLNDTYLPIAIERQDEVAQTLIESIKHDLAALPMLPLCLVHHDIHLGNLVMKKTSKETGVQHQLVILDWEYAAIGNPWFDASCLSRYLSIEAHKIHALTVFKPLDSSTFHEGLARANIMTEALQKLWYWARE